MSAPILLIDGYNLLHAAGLAQSEYRPGDLLRCRTRLLKLLLGKLSSAEIQTTTIVFDARDPPPDRPARVVISGITVLFANPGGDADRLIQEWLARHPTPRRVILVSGDKLLQRAARSCGAKFVGSHDFLQDLDRRRSAVVRGTRADPELDEKPGSQLSEAQTAYWLNIFGGVPLAELEPTDEPAALPPPSSPAKSKPTRRAGRPPRRGKPNAVPCDAKPSARTAREELDYWLEIFGPAAAGTNDRSAEELRLADLEAWLKEFKAKET